ncbi:hypothetical protein GQ457_06G035210 [Hibiscus cannabinus]
MSGTIKVLNVAEKPSVAKSVSGLLSRNQGLRVRDGRSRYNKIFEFNYSIRGQPCHMLFTSVTGHLMELEFEDRFRKWHSCDPGDLYHAPVRKSVPEDKLDIKRTLEEEARRCQWLVLWLDCDREGENIAFEVIEVCRAVNRHLTIRRARFSALIEREIHHATQNLIDPNQWFSDAVDARQEIDLRIGASFTRFQTMLLRDKFVIDSATDDRNLVLSYGPCQFPTLGFVVERYWEVQSHEPEEFWTINCSHKSDEGVATFNWMRGHLFDYTCAVIVYEMCVQEPNATVSKVQHQEKLKYPPYPLSTIELEKRASRYFRMSSEHTMKVAEDLYQAGFISYPRTETDSFSSRTDLHAIVQEQQEHPEWGSYAQRLLDPETGLWRNPGSGGHDDKAHPPIHPTKFSAGEHGWSQDHRKLYELVVRHFLACVSQPAVGAETIVEIDIAGELFSASGRMILERNYLDVYRYESWGASMIPTYTVGQQFIPTSLTLDTGVTRPPPLLSEADLLSCMDKAGIGTDATMHDHIKKLLDRFYATKDSNTRFSPTNLINGKQCGVLPQVKTVTPFSLGNICRTWTKEALKEKLKHYGVDNVEDLTLVEDSNNEGMNRGFAFLEFASHSDAMDAFKRLQRRDVLFGVDRPAKVSFADSFIDPGDEIMAQFRFRTIFIDCLPPSWDEDRVRELLKKYGEIEKIELARNMQSSGRKDYGFVTCAKSINNTELGEGDIKAKVRARLSRPHQRGRDKHISRDGFRYGRGSRRVVRGSWDRSDPRGFSPCGVRGITNRAPPPSLKRPVGLRGKRPLITAPTRGRPSTPPPSRSYDRRAPAIPYPKSSLKREYGRRDELPPSRSRGVMDYGSRVVPDRHSSYREEYSSRNSGYFDLPRSTSRTVARKPYVDDSYAQRFERQPPGYREGRGRGYETMSGSKDHMLLWMMALHDMLIWVLGIQGLV